MEVSSKSRPITPEKGCLSPSLKQRKAAYFRSLKFAWGRETLVFDSLALDVRIPSLFSFLESGFVPSFLFLIISHHRVDVDLVHVAFSVHCACPTTSDLPRTSNEGSTSTKNKNPKINSKTQNTQTLKIKLILLFSNQTQNRSHAS